MQAVFAQCSAHGVICESLRRVTALQTGGEAGACLTAGRVPEMPNNGSVKRQHGGATFSTHASTGNPVAPRIDFDSPPEGDAAGRASSAWQLGGGRPARSLRGVSEESAADRRESDGPALLAWCLTAPVVLFYLMFIIVHHVYIAKVTDSEGCEHAVRMRVTANFMGPWLFMFIIDFFCLCPAHYWLTLYDGTNTVDWARNGNADGTRWNPSLWPSAVSRGRKRSTSPSLSSNYSVAL